MEDDDARHKREERERRDKRKAHKASRSEEQKEKDRKRKEYRQNILKQQGQPGSNKKQKTGAPDTSSSSISEFQKLFEQRAQGFQMDFRFRNAPPRPPVGPCFVGQNVDAVLQQHAQQYRALNSVEVHHRWRLHNESDLGVPLAPSAMDVKSYTSVPKERSSSSKPLHPDDERLLDWKGPWGDTAAYELKLKQDRARAAARAAAAGRVLPMLPPPKPSSAPAAASSAVKSKKAFSRVLKEDGAMPTFMKKTTYLSNDYSRKVHDFKSLAQTKQQLAKDLEHKQEEMAKRRSASAIAKAFDQNRNVVHPTQKKMKPKRVFSVLPAVQHWGMPFTHLVIDKKPTLPEQYPQSDLRQSLVANVEKPDQNARMTCEVFAPSRRDAPQEDEDDKDEPPPPKDSRLYESIQGYDLDIIPLKDEDAPHQHFCLVLNTDTQVASYIPISSRIQLSTGRPSRRPTLRPIRRRPETHKEKSKREERMADVDKDMAEKHGLDDDDDDDDDDNDESPMRSRPSGGGSGAAAAKTSNRQDDGEDDFGDDDDDSSGDEGLFGGGGGGSKTIVAEN